MPGTSWTLLQVKEHFNVKLYYVRHCSRLQFVLRNRICQIAERRTEFSTGTCSHDMARHLLAAGVASALYCVSLGHEAASNIQTAADQFEYHSFLLPRS